MMFLSVSVALTVKVDIRKGHSSSYECVHLLSNLFFSFSSIQDMPKKKKKPYIFKLGAFPSFTIVFIICLVCICRFCFNDALFPNRHIDIMYNFTY